MSCEKSSIILHKDVTRKIESQKDQLKKTCRQFEGIFINYMLQQMRKTIPKSGFFEESISYDIFTSMYDQALSEEITKNNSLGLADDIYRQLSRHIDEIDE